MSMIIDSSVNVDRIKWALLEVCISELWW